MPSRSTNKTLKALQRRLRLTYTSAIPAESIHAPEKTPRFVAIVLYAWRIPIAEFVDDVRDVAREEKTNFGAGRR